MPHCAHVRLPRQRMRRCSRVGAEGAVAGGCAARRCRHVARGSIQRAAQGTGAVAQAAHDLEGRRRSSVVRLRADHVAYRRAHTLAPCPRPAPCAAAGAASACWRRRSAAPCPPARAAARRRGARASNTAPPPSSATAGWRRRRQGLVAARATLGRDGELALSPLTITPLCSRPRTRPHAPPLYPHHPPTLTTQWRVSRPPQLPPAPPPRSRAQAAGRRASAAA